MTSSKSQWYKEWFDSRYYHILYKNRNHDEAAQFIHRLLNYLNIKDVEQKKGLDLACGKGRHTINLAQSGLSMTGIDLSPNNIEAASTQLSHKAHFKVGDMRVPFGDNEYDFIFNLFTSFGYFENNDIDFLIIGNIAKALKKNGCLILDYLNPVYTLDNLIPYEEKTIKGITFSITKTHKPPFVFKHIEVQDSISSFKFYERVKIIDLELFKEYFKTQGLTLKHLFGDYDLSPFESKSQPRLIMMTQKN